MPKYTLGLDYGSGSVRALVVDVETGREVGTGICEYGVYTDPKDPNVARQKPSEYIEGFYSAVREALKGISAEQVVGIGVDTTGSTPIPLDAFAQPLENQFPDDLNAYAWMWKDHTSIAEAEEITARDGRYLSKIGGKYSSEWYWAKLMHFSRVAPKVFEATAAWVELCDFIPAYLTGVRDASQIKRSSCAAGHKAIWHSDWGGLPAAEFWGHSKLAEKGHFDAVAPASSLAGGLCREVAEKCGLRVGTPVSVGAFDAHLGAVGCGVRSGMLVKIVGTSTCDIMLAPEGVADIPGICGIAENSVLPGYLGVEAGQSAVGELFAWAAEQLSDGDHAWLQQEAAIQKPGESGLVALDWNNGNRTILVDQALSGLILGQTLQTTAAEIYRAMIEATAYGARKIIERLREYGVEIKEVVACGGIAEKSPLVMQIYADVLNLPILQSSSSQTCALGSAIMGAVAAGVYPDCESAVAAMTRLKEQAYRPQPKAAATYDKLYAIYSQLHDAFGVAGTQSDLSQVMKQLIQIRQEARA